MRKHTSRYATALATTVAVSLSVFGLATSATAAESQSVVNSTNLATELDAMPTLMDAPRFSAACFGEPDAEGSDLLPGISAVVDVHVPEGIQPVLVSVLYADGELLFSETVTETKQVTGGGPVPVGDYDMVVMFDDYSVGSGFVISMACEQVANPGSDVEEPAPAPEPAPVTEPSTEPAPEVELEPAPVAEPDLITSPEPVPVPASEPAPSVAPVTPTVLEDEVSSGNDEALQHNPGVALSSLVIAVGSVALLVVLSIVFWLLRKKWTSRQAK